MKNKYLKRVLISREEIEKKCKELASWVDETYKSDKELILVGLLKGSVPFMAQLMKEIKRSIKIDFMRVSSYHDKMESSGNVKVIQDMSMDVDSKDILIVEDIVDTGYTLTKVVNLLNSRSANSVKVLTLLDKPKGRKVEFIPDKSGFTIENVFVVGFGLDLNEHFRELGYIGEFDIDCINEFN